MPTKPLGISTHDHDSAARRVNGGMIAAAPACGAGAVMKERHGW